jgi:hypothetical protein
MILTGILVTVSHGKELQEHQKNGGEFHSFWKAIGISILCAIPFVIAVFSAAFLTTDDFDYEAQNDKIEEFTNNEDTALLLYTKLGVETDLECKKFIDETALPLWKKNIIIIDEFIQAEGSTKKEQEQNQTLKEYINKRIESYETISQHLESPSLHLEDQLNALDREIEQILDDLNAE